MRRRICRMIRLVWRSTSGIEYRSNPTAVCLFLHAPRCISRPWACRNPCSSGSRSLSCRGTSSTSGQWFHSTSTIAHSLRCRGNHWIHPGLCLRPGRRPRHTCRRPGLRGARKPKHPTHRDRSGLTLLWLWMRSYRQQLRLPSWFPLVLPLSQGLCCSRLRLRNRNWSR